MYTGIPVVLFLIVLVLPCVFVLYYGSREVDILALVECVVLVPGTSSQLNQQEAN